MNVSIPQLADTLFERTANSSWVVVFKALIASHHLMMYGNEGKRRFLVLASSLAGVAQRFLSPRFRAGCIDPNGL
ncbi:Phosphatidylinositol-binding clathrin assembly protein [Liparis tanakae]|uniref:Phosphatidylinositol-binding clathrin assembly protein n=1 Tax=Liparis tanakae TaxID=230148 RepID=A0A4Z2EIJ4_9TELE|nr:Phosphatidylinositol-binding clathrin assembly protein [Liparis tanakae]